MNTFKIYDLHNDLLTSKSNYKDKIEWTKKIEKVGNRSINAIFNDGYSWQKAKNMASIFSLKQGMMIAFENCCYPDFEAKRYGFGFDSNEKIIAYANSLMRFKPYYLSLCWNDKSLFASGCACEGGVTSAGLRFIDEINVLGGVLDTAHINERGFYEVVDRAERVICSHTAFSFIFPHRRNVSKEQIRVILQKGGIVGLVAVGHFLTGAKRSINAYENAFYRHIDGYLQEFGDLGLTIATDFYGSDAPVFLNESYNFVDLLANRLISRGISENSVKKLLYTNARDFFEKSQKKCN